MPLVINSLGRGHTHTHTQTCIPTIHTGSILRNQALTGFKNLQFHNLLCQAVSVAATGKA